MQDKPTQEPSSVLGPDVPAINAGFYRGLADGPIEELCRFFGLGPRVTDVLTKLKCKTGLDLSRLNPNAWYHISGETTGRRIFLLCNWVQLKQSERAGDIAGPSGSSDPIPVGEVARKANFVK